MTDFALVPEDSTVVHPDELAAIGAAINIQVAKHVGPAWGLQGTVSTFSSPALVPAGFVPVVIRTNAGGVAGCHTDKGSVCAIVQYEPDWTWSVAASHEIIETLIDPTLSIKDSGPDPRDATKQVSFIREACDPCAGETYEILVNQSVAVANFCLPAYYALSSGSLTWMEENGSGSSITAPWTVGFDGYLTWLGPDGYYQLTSTNTIGPYTQDQIFANASKKNLRGAIDRFADFKAPPHLRAGARSKVAVDDPRGTLRRNDHLTKWLAKTH